MRITPLRSVLALTVLLAIPAAPAMAQNLVRGTVMDAKDQPVEGAVVLFEAIKFVNKRDVKTDKKGQYLFQGLTSGEYKVTASKQGVGTHTRNYTVSTNSAKEKLDFYLMPDQAAIAAIAASNAAAKAKATPGPPGLESLGPDAAAVAKGKELAALQAVAKAGVEAQNAGKHEEAVARFTELVGKVPECADCYIRLGVSYYELQKYDDAVTTFKKSIDVRPSVEAYTALARIYNNQKKFDLAAEASKNAAELSAKQSAEAQAAGGKASPGAKAAPPSPALASDTLYNQGVVLWNGGKFAEAKEQFEAAVKANPENANAQYQLGMANLNLGQLAAARFAFEAYLALEPDGTKATEVRKFIPQLPRK